jgi:O-antigen ligase
MVLIGVILGVAVLVWGLVYALRGSLIHGCLVFLVAALCFGRDFLRFDVGPLPLSIDRILLVGLILVYVVKRRLGLVDPKPPAWPDVAMLLLAMVLALSAFSCNWDLDASGKVFLWQLVAGFLMPMIVYWIARQCPIDQRALVTTYVVLVAIGVYLSLTALAEITKQWWLVYPSYIADPKVGIHFGRARGPMVGSQTLGLYLDACLLCLWMLRHYVGRNGKLILILLVPLFVAAIYVTYTRCVWIGAGVCGLLVLGLPMSNRRRTVFVGSVLVAAALVTALRWESLVRMQREGGAAVSELSAKSRVSFAYVSWKMFLDAPLLGVGYGQFQQAVRPYLSDRSTSLYLDDIRNEPNHNTLLAMLTETGLIGFGLYVALLSGWAIQSWLLWRNTAAPDWIRAQGLMMLGTLVIYLAPALFVDVRFSPPAQYLTFFLAGLTSGLAARWPASSATRTHALIFPADVSSATWGTSR